MLFRSPCSTHVIEELKKEYDLTLFFYNPNIEPLEEYELRLKQIEEYSKKLSIPILIGDYDNIEWHNKIQGHETDKEGEERCKICFRLRLEKTAKLAREKGFELFTTTLTISPFKNAEVINKIGKEIQEINKIGFLKQDFKKGYMHSIELSKKHDLYRQNYCGCSFSKQ